MLNWILCEDKMPEEHDSMFIHFKGTSRWSKSMFEKTSNEVLVTVEYADGTRWTKTSCTLDGKWKNDGIYERKVVAWMPLPEPYTLQSSKGED